MDPERLVEIPGDDPDAVVQSQQLVRRQLREVLDLRHALGHFEKQTAQLRVGKPDEVRQLQYEAISSQWASNRASNLW